MHLILPILLGLVSNINGRQFRLGHSLGGNLGAPVLPEHIKLPEAQWFKQKLDHFSPSSIETWQQRYYINDSFFDYKNPGPVFLMVGGEGPADPRWMVTGAWINYAKRFKALCINLEHRFYGESHPTSDTSVKNLVYLTSQQALADLAYFISAINEKYKFNDNTKWVAFGGSYPGSLAAWLRMKYPHLVHAAVSASGPLLAEVDFMQYYQVVANALREKTGDERCVNQVREGHKQIRQMVKDSPMMVESRFRLCKPLSQASDNDKKNLYNAFADNFADLVQYNEDNRISMKEEYRNMTINTVCKLLTEPGSSPPYERLAIFNSIMLDKSNQSCLDYGYDKMISGLRNDSWQADNVVGGARQWTYQTCTEFGFYQTSSGEPDLFGNDFTLSFFIQQCEDIFGKKFNAPFLDRVVDWTNSFYGALDISVSRVVFVHGSIDPWHALGITKTRDHDAPAIFIHGTAHCANMYPPRDEDLPALKAARVEIAQYLDIWLDQQ